MFPYPASWHTPPLPPPVACECLAALDAALPGSGVKAKASLSSDKWARQDIFAETQPKPLEKQPLMRIVFPFGLLQCWTHAKGPGNFLFIFSLFIHKILSNPILPGPDTGHISISHTRQNQWTVSRQLKHHHSRSQRSLRREIMAHFFLWSREKKVNVSQKCHKHDNLLPSQKDTTCSVKGLGFTQCEE